jgi:hypothetical protein
MQEKQMKTTANVEVRTIAAITWSHDNGLRRGRRLRGIAIPILRFQQLRSSFRVADYHRESSDQQVAYW